MSVSDNNAPETSRKLSDEELAYYAALDPHAMTSTKPWELEVRSPSLKRLAWICIVVVMAVHIFMGYFLDLEFTGASISFIDQ